MDPMSKVLGLSGCPGIQDIRFNPETFSLSQKTVGLDCKLFCSILLLKLRSPTEAFLPLCPVKAQFCSPSPPAHNEWRLKMGSTIRPLLSHTL